MVGFVSFLTGLSGKMVFSTNLGNYEDVDLNSAGYTLKSMVDWLKVHPIWLIMGMISIIFIIFIVLLFLWISSRAKFVFLDDIINDHLKIRKPWGKYSKQGNTLFLWRLIFRIVCILIVAGIIKFQYIQIYQIILQYKYFFRI